MRISITDAAGGRPDEPVRRDLGRPAGLDRTDPRAAASCCSASDPNPERIVLAPTLAPSRRPTSATRTPERRSASSTTTSATSSCWRRVAPTLVSGGLQREITTKPTARQLSVATFNVENLDPTDPQTKFDTPGRRSWSQPAVARRAGAGGDPGQHRRRRRRRGRGRRRRRQADRGDHRGRRADLRVARDRPGQRRRRRTAGRQHPGGVPVPDRPRALLRRPPGRHSTTATTVTRDPAGRPQLSFSPGRIDPTNAAWTDSRKPLAGEFRLRGRTVFVIANHFVSKGGDDPLFGPVPAAGALAGPAGPAGDRGARTSSTRSWRPTGTPNVVVLGDLNDFEFSAPSTR